MSAFHNHRVAATASFALALAFTQLATSQEVVSQDVVFATDVLPFLQAKCFECHDAAKSKGELRLDGRAFIERGGEGEDAIDPSDPEASGMLRRVTLPEDDPDFMPAKGPALSPEETATLRRWIEQGAEFGDWVGEVPGSKSVRSKRREPAGPTPFETKLDTIANDVAPLDPKLLARLAGKEAQIHPVATGSPLLRVAFLGSQGRIDDPKLQTLAPLVDHIAVLDLGKTRITDAALLSVVGKMKRLVRLNLRETTVTTKGLRALETLPHLEALNLNGAKLVDQSALEVFGKMPTLRRVYTWRSGISAAAIEGATLRADLLVFGAPRLPKPPAAQLDEPASGRVMPRKRRKKD